MSILQSFFLSITYILYTFAQINSDRPFNVMNFIFESFSTVRNLMNVGSTAGLSDPLPGFPAAVMSFRFRSLFKIFFKKEKKRKCNTRGCKLQPDSGPRDVLSFVFWVFFVVCFVFFQNEIHDACCVSRWRPQTAPSSDGTTIVTVKAAGDVTSPLQLFNVAPSPTSGRTSGNSSSTVRSGQW